jgi:hypothetical protein
MVIRTIDQVLDYCGADEAEANARLISAAPDLLEALETAARRFRDYERIHREKRTSEGNLKADNNADLAEYCERAIAKARGEVA